MDVGDGAELTPEQVRGLVGPYDVIEFVDESTGNVQPPPGWDDDDSVIQETSSRSWEEWFAAVYRDDRRNVVHTWTEVRQSPGRVLPVRYRQRTATGWRWVQLTYLNLTHTPLGVIASAYRYLDDVDVDVEEAQPSAAMTTPLRWFVTEQDAQGFITRCDGRPETILGRTGADMVGRSALEHLSEEDTERMLDLWMRVITESGSTGTASMAVRHLDGSTRWCDLVITNRLDDPAVGAVVAMVIDAEERRRAEAELRASERRFRALAEQLPVAVFLGDPQGEIVYANRSFRDMLGSACSVAEISDELPRHWSAISGEANSRMTFERDGRQFEVVLSAPSTALAELGDGDADFGVDRFIVGSVVDVTASRNRVRDLVALADTDPLTGLANRRALERRLNEEHERGRPMFAAMIDLDGFKMFNDIYGHRAGDRALVEAARRFAALVEGDQLAARFGGDEFVIVAPADDAEVVAALLERIETELASALFSDENELVTGSLGYAWSEPTDEPGSLLDRADAVMYSNKRNRTRARYDASASNR